MKADKNKVDCGNAAGAKPRVTVAMLTFRRPRELDRILPLLVEQANSIDPPASVLVVDNDPAASARNQVATWEHRGVRYVHEPVPGIAAARNRAMAEVGRDADALVFIDDDETPGTRWLATLVAQWLMDGSAAVSGPVSAVFQVDPDPWVIGSRVFERRAISTGERVPWAASNNLLLDTEQVRRHGVTFDEQYGVSGGSDSLFTKRLVQRGAVITWCNEAEVFDPIPVERSTRRWVLRRTFRYGNGWVRIQIDLARTFRARVHARLDAHHFAAYLLIRGSRFYLLGLLTRNPHHRGYGACRLSTALGVLSGAYGHIYHEYRRHAAA